MPVRSLPVTDHASRVLLESIVDYAGLFPPAALTMTAAVHAYAHYRASGNGWMLGRFICPATELEQFSTAADPLLPRDAGAIPWRLSVTGSGDLTADLAAITSFNQRHLVCFDDRGAIVDMYEAKAESPDAITRVSAMLPKTLETYFELPLTASSDELDTMMAAVARHGHRAKMRAGGITTDAFPTADAIITFLDACLRHGVAAKATAGLHHPVCGYYRLAYDDQAPTGAMFGFLNVFLAAAALAAGHPHGDARLLLVESNPSAFEINDSHVAWRGPEHAMSFDRALLQRVRHSVLMSFGSCSFTEPMNEIRALGFV